MGNNPFDSIMKGITNGAESTVQSGANRIMKGKTPELPEFLNNITPGNSTADNYQRKHPDAIRGHTADDGKSIEFTAPRALVTVAPDHTTTVQFKDASVVTAGPDNFLMVTAAGGNAQPVNNSKLSNHMVKIGDAAARDVSHGANFLSGANAQALVNDAQHAIGSLKPGSTPPGTAGGKSQSR